MFGPPVAIGWGESRQCSHRGFRLPRGVPLMQHPPPSLFPSDRERPAAWSASIPSHSGVSSAALARADAASTFSSLPSPESARETLPAGVLPVGFLVLALALCCAGRWRACGAWRPFFGPAVGSGGNDPSHRFPGANP